MSGRASGGVEAADDGRYAALAWAERQALQANTISDRICAEMAAQAIRAALAPSALAGNGGQTPGEREHIATAHLIPWEPGSLGGVAITFESGLQAAVPLSASEPAPASDLASTGPDLAGLAYSIVEMVARYAIVSVDGHGTPVVAFAAGCAEALVAGPLARAGRLLPVQRRPAPLDREAVGREVFVCLQRRGNEGGLDGQTEEQAREYWRAGIFPWDREWAFIVADAILALALPPDATDPAVERDDAGLVRMLSADNARMRAAGLALSEAALHVIREYDGTHRLSLAVAEWAKAVANEGGREDRFADLVTTPSLRSGLPEQGDQGAV